MGIHRSWRENWRIKEKGRDNTMKPTTQSIAVNMEYIRLEIIINQIYYTYLQPPHRCNIHNPPFTKYDHCYIKRRCTMNISCTYIVKEKNIGQGSF